MDLRTVTQRITVLTPEQARELGFAIDRVAVYIDEAGEYRWRRVAAGNFEPIGSNGEGHPDPKHTERMALRANAIPFVLTNEGRPGQVWLVDAGEIQ